MSRVLSPCTSSTYCKRLMWWKKLKKQAAVTLNTVSNIKCCQLNIHPAFFQKKVDFHSTSRLLFLKDFNAKWNLLCPYRLKSVGYEIAATELLLRNKAYIKWKDEDKVFMDSFDLPPDGPEKTAKAIPEEVYIMEASYLLPDGFLNIGFLITIKKLVINGNTRVDMKCMEVLFETYLWDALEYLELSNLDQFSSEDMVKIASEFGPHFKVLVIYNLPKVHDMEELAKSIQICYPDLTIHTQPQGYPEEIEKRPKRKGSFFRALF